MSQTNIILKQVLNLSKAHKLISRNKNQHFVSKPLHALPQAAACYGQTYDITKNITLCKCTCIVNPCNERKRQNEDNRTQNTTLRRKQMVFRPTLVPLVINLISKRFTQLWRCLALKNFPWSKKLVLTAV